MSNSIAQPVHSRMSLLCLAAAALLSSLGVSSANVALPTIAAAFGTGVQATQWVVIAYLLSNTAVIVLAGHLGDNYGRKRVLLVGMWLYACASLLCGLSGTIGLMIASRAVQGLGGAILMALSMALVRDTVPQERLGKAMGALGSISAIGTAAGPSIGGALLSFFGWQSIFYTVAILAFVTAGLSQVFVIVGTNNVSREKGGINFLGVIALVFTLGSFAGAMTTSSNHFGQQSAFALAASALGLMLFLLVETRATNPLLPLTLFQNADLSAGLVLNSVVAMVMMATLVVPPFYLSVGLGLAAVQVGLAMAVGPLVSAITGFFAGKMTDRYGPSRIQLIGLVEMTIGAIGLALLPEAIGVVGYLTALAVLTPGYQLFQAANNTKTMSKITSVNRGAISGLLNLSRNLGLITGATLMGTLFAVSVGMSNAGTATADAMAHGMQITFLTAAGLLALATVFFATSRSSS